MKTGMWAAFFMDTESPKGEMAEEEVLSFLSIDFEGFETGGLSPSAPAGD